MSGFASCPGFGSNVEMRRRILRDARQDPAAARADVADHVRLAPFSDRAGQGESHCRDNRRIVRRGAARFDQLAARQCRLRHRDRIRVLRVLHLVSIVHRRRADGRAPARFRKAARRRHPLESGNMVAGAAGFEFAYLDRLDHWRRRRQCADEWPCGDRGRRLEPGERVGYALLLSPVVGFIFQHCRCWR